MGDIRVKKEKGCIHLLLGKGQNAKAATSISYTPVNEALLPVSSRIYIDEEAFSLMCMDYVRAKGESALIAAAEAKPNRDAAILALTSAAIAAGKTPREAVSIAREACTLLDMGK